MKLSNLTDTQYLTYYLKRAKKSIDHYEAFVAGMLDAYNETDLEFADKVYQTYFIDIRPYLYTINNITTHEYATFLTYVHHYLRKGDYNEKEIKMISQVKGDIDTITNINVHGLVNLLKCSNLMLVSVLFLMQYYFL
jgi:hypothetical protein